MTPKTQSDYHALAMRRGMRWVGAMLPANADEVTRWQCNFCGHTWTARYGNICHRDSSCPNCVDVVRGRRVSKLQRRLCDMLNGEINRPCGPYSIDVAIHVDDVAIAVEYDAWYWHGNRDAEDIVRMDALKSAGWRVLRIKSNSLLPSIDQINFAVQRLRNGADFAEIELEDWGTGDTIDARKRASMREARQVPASPIPDIEIDVASDQCVAELDGLRLFIRDGDVDLNRATLTPAEARILRQAMIAEPIPRAGRILRFNAKSVGTALGHSAVNFGVATTLVARLRKRVHFVASARVGLIHPSTREWYETTVRMRLRPRSRASLSVLTSYNVWRPFKEARRYARSLGLNSQTAWHAWAKSPLRPLDIPTNPNRAYRAHGWSGYPDWLGKKSQ